MAGLLVVSVPCVVVEEGGVVICWGGCCVGRFAVGMAEIWIIAVIITFVLRIVGISRVGEKMMYIMNVDCCEDNIVRKETIV